MKELTRIENVPLEAYATSCRRCGKPITLWFNGGELDVKTCCGLEYSLEHVRIDFVIREREPQE